MSLSHIILGMLHRGPQTGYDLDKQINQYIHYAWTTNRSAVYRNLHKLRDLDLVEFERVEQDDSPDKKVYALTDKGLAELKSWLATPGLERQTRNPFLIQLLWGHLIDLPQQILILEERLSQVEENLRILEQRANFPDQIGIPLPKDALRRGLPRNALSLDYGVRSYHFEKEWLQDTLALLKHTLQMDPTSNGDH
ncbi:MAG: PadR family transcriptional regulator [Chloroflexi bacterium]|nr:PadR family transcriptional regulator [Chloroflexota bacterium]